MPPIRHRSRHLHATFFNQFRTALTGLGWISSPINFGTVPVTLVDYQPDDRQTQIKQNTVAVSLGDYNQDDDEELGAALGGLRSAGYSIYIDVYMTDLAISLALCDDIRDIYTDLTLPLINQITASVVPDTRIEVEAVVGPDRPPNAITADAFRKHWRTMRLDGRLFFLS